MIIGLTGSFGTGKTTVAKIFKDLGAKVIDADRIVHSIIDKRTRKRLAEIVFKRKDYLDKLCKIIHPLVIDKIRQSLKSHKNKIVVIDAPLLIETGLHKKVDILIVVKANKDRQITRLMKKSGLTKKDILKRIKFQLPLREKIARADFVIDNNGRLEETKRQVVQIWERIRR